MAKKSKKAKPHVKIDVDGGRREFVDGDPHAPEQLPLIWQWRQGVVDRRQAHFELRSGSAYEGGWDDWFPVALVGPPRKGVFPVQFLPLDNIGQDEDSLRSKVTGELDFYLVEKGESDPWEYGRYHCTTAANIYSSVHWSFIQPSNDRVRAPVAPLNPGRHDPMARKSKKAKPHVKIDVDGGRWEFVDDDPHAPEQEPLTFPGGVSAEEWFDAHCHETGAPGADRRAWLRAYPTQTHAPDCTGGAGAPDRTCSGCVAILAARKTKP
jgi:hypothetical protein